MRPTRSLLTAVVLAAVGGCSAKSSGHIDAGADSTAGEGCQPASCRCPGSTSNGTRSCAEAGLGPCVGCQTPLDSGVADTATDARDGATQDAPGDEGGPDTGPGDAATCTPDDLTCKASTECCNDQCVGGVCCFATDAGGCGVACVASGSGVACSHDFDCCGAIFGSTCKGGVCCNATGQLCNGNDSWCCSGVCSGNTCN